MTTTELQTLFFKETGTEAFNTQGEPDIDYVEWLEKRSHDYTRLHSIAEQMAEAMRRVNDEYPDNYGSLQLITSALAAWREFKK